MTPASAGDDRATNERLLRERLARELRAARAFAEDRVGHLFPGLFGRLVNPLARALYHAIGEEEVRRRIARQLEIALDAARDADRIGLEAALDVWTPRALETEEAYHRGNRNHPRYPELRELLVDAFRNRVLVLGQFVALGRGRTYEEAVRVAFPGRADVERAFASEFASALRAVHLVEEDPALLRFPRRLVRPLLHLIRDSVAWYETRIAATLDGIYGSDAEGSARAPRETE